MRRDQIKMKTAVRATEIQCSAGCLQARGEVDGRTERIYRVNSGQKENQLDIESNDEKPKQARRATLPS